MKTSRFPAIRHASPIFIHLCMVISATLVSTSFIVGKEITPFMDPVLLTWIRFSLATILFAPYVFCRYKITCPTWSALIRYSVIGATLSCFFWLMFLALKTTNALNTGALFTTVPGIAGIYSRFLLREQLGGSRVLALMVAMLGALWVIFQGDWSRFQQLKVNQGDLLFFLGCLLMAMYTPLVKLFHRGEPMAVMTWWILATGSIWLLALSLTRLSDFAWQDVPWKVWAGVGYLAVFTTIITFFISQWATLYLGPTRVMAYSYLYPPLIVAIEWLIYQRFPADSTVFGVLFILPAMVIIQRGRTDGLSS